MLSRMQIASLGRSRDKRASFANQLRMGLVSGTLGALSVTTWGFVFATFAWRHWVSCRVANVNCHSAESATFVALIATIAAMVPFVLPLLVALVSGRSLIGRAEFTLGAQRAHPQSWAAAQGSGDNRAELYHLARRHWDYQQSQAHVARDRLVIHALFYGFISTLLVSSLGSLLVYYGDDFSTHTSRGRFAQIVLALLAAVVTRFLLDVGQMLVRSAKRDSSSRMFACGVRYLTTTLLAAGAFRALLWVSNAATPNYPALASVVAGVLAAFLGERALDIAVERAAKLVGVEPPPRATGVTLTLLDGLEPADERRLDEEGIETVHALAFASTPKLFFNTSFGLEQVCDWQDQALLIAKLGEPRALYLRNQLGIRKVSEFVQLAGEYFKAESPAKQELLAQLNLGNALAAEATLRRITSDETIAMLGFYRLAMPRIRDEASARSLSPEDDALPETSNA